MLIYQGKLPGIFSKGRYFPLHPFSFYEMKGCISHKAQAVIFPALPGLEGRNTAVRDKPFLATSPFSDNLQENSQPANANFVLLPSNMPLNEGFKQGHSSNSVHSVFTAGCTEVERQDLPVFSIWFCQLIYVRYYFPQSSKKQSDNRSTLSYSINYSGKLSHKT